MRELVTFFSENMLRLNQVSGNIANIVTVGTALISLLTFATVLWQTKLLRQNMKGLSSSNNLKKLIRSGKDITTDKPVALAIDLITGDNSLKISVKKFLTLEYAKRKINIASINMQGIKDENDIEELYHKVKQTRQYLDNKGYTEVLLFVKAPVQAGTIIGSMMNNWIPVKLYHFQQGKYEYWTPLVKYFN